MVILPALAGVIIVRRADALVRRFQILVRATRRLQDEQRAETVIFAKAVGLAAFQKRVVQLIRHRLRRFREFVRFVESKSE